jgi:hypothetical protein
MRSPSRDNPPRWRCAAFGDTVDPEWGGCLRSWYLPRSSCCCCPRHRPHRFPRQRLRSTARTSRRRRLRRRTSSRVAVRRSTPEGLDRDRDGIACESLPCPCNYSTTPPPPPPPLPPPPTTASTATAARYRWRRRCGRDRCVPNSARYDSGRLSSAASPASNCLCGDVRICGFRTARSAQAARTAPVLRFCRQLVAVRAAVAPLGRGARVRTRQGCRVLPGELRGETPHSSARRSRDALSTARRRLRWQACTVLHAGTTAFPARDRCVSGHGHAPSPLRGVAASQRERGKRSRSKASCSSGREPDEHKTQSGAHRPL